MAGAQVRATAAAVDEGALEAVRRRRAAAHGDLGGRARQLPRRAGAMLAAALGGLGRRTDRRRLAEAPPWIGAAGRAGRRRRRPGDPALVDAAATAVRRGARVVVVAPYEGPLRDATAGPRGRAGAAAAGSRRLRAVPLSGGRSGHPACRRSGRCGWISPRSPTNWTPRRCATAPPRSVHQSRQDAGRPDVRRARWCWPATAPATLALARHGGAVMLRVAHQAVARGRPGRCHRRAAHGAGRPVRSRS